MKLRITLALLVGSLVAAACGSSSSTSSTGSGGGATSGTTSGGSTCGKPGRTGETDCLSNGPCNAGQWCDADDYHTCKPGCLADSNCDENQHCVLCGSDAIGVCRNCDQSTESVCGCQVDAFTSGVCKDQGKPSLGIKCASGQEPMVTGCSPGEFQGDWCCPDPNASDAGPTSNCMRDTTQDQIQCGGGFPPKAYFCPSDEEPTQMGCEQGPGIGSGIWCCPT